MSNQEHAAAADAADLLHLALDAARAGGLELLAARGAATGVATKGSSNNFVSDADRASEQAVVAALTRVRPDDGILGEEGAQRDSDTGIRWVIDPLDGTTNYLYGLESWSVSIAVEQRTADGGWEAVAGVVHDPAQGETFTASRGGGAWLLGAGGLAVNDPVPLDRALVATGFAYAREPRQRQARMIAHVLPRVRDVRRRGSAALDLCALASGRVDAFYEDDLEAWDVAAGALIAAEAGATMTPLRRGVMGAGPALHGPLAALLAEADSGDPGAGTVSP